MQVEGLRLVADNSERYVSIAEEHYRIKTTERHGRWHAEVELPHMILASRERGYERSRCH